MTAPITVPTLITAIINIELENGTLKTGDLVAITGPTTGYEECIVESLFVQDEPSPSAERGQKVTIPLKFRARKNDKVYRIENRTRWQS